MDSTIIFESKEEKAKKEELAKPKLFKRSKISKKGILSDEAAILLRDYFNLLEREKVGSAEPNVEVSQVLAPVAFFYERIRNAVDYKSEHLLKRNAIERILRRQIWERPGRDPYKIARYLVRELIWARYLKNDSVPKSKLKAISPVIEKYLEIFHLIAVETKKDKSLSRSSDLKDWFMGIASCEIEEIIDPFVPYLDVLNYPVFSWFKKHFDWQDKEIDEKDKDIQILIAVHRSLPKSDTPRIRYHLLKTYHKDWENIQLEELSEQMSDIFKIREEIEKQLDSSIQPRLYRYVQRQSAAFQVLKTIVEKDIENAEAIFNNEKKLEKEIRKVCEERYDEIRNKVNRGITRSIIYIFTSKVLLALLIEIPYELIFIGSLNFLSIILNTVVPPSMMFLLGLTIRKPGESNTKRIISKIKSFIYDKKGEERITFSLTPTNRDSFTYKIFIYIYALLFLLTFGAITYLLITLEFNIISGVIFFVFLSLVLLFGYRVRFTANELSVTGEDEGLISHLFSNVTLPFLNLGVWLSEGLAKLNFLIVIMDFLIETPLKNIIGVFEEWTSFIREKREEVVEVPT